MEITGEPGNLEEKAISLIGHLAASSYEYTDKLVESMFAALQDELNTQKAKFTKKGTDRPFRF